MTYLLEYNVSSSKRAAWVTWGVFQSRAAANADKSSRIAAIAKHDLDPAFVALSFRVRGVRS